MVINGIDFKPLGRKLLLRKCTTGEMVVDEHGIGYKVGALFVIPKRGDHQHWCEIIEVSEDCKHFNQSHIGGFVWIPEWNPVMMFRLDGTEADWIVREELFDPKGGKMGSISDANLGKPLVVFVED
jgi:hypothetical protein